MKTRNDIATWCTDFIANTFEIPRAEVEGNADLQSFGFDSTSLVSFAIEIEGFLGCDVSPSALFEHPTIDDLSAYLVTAQGAPA